VASSISIPRSWGGSSAGPGTGRPVIGATTSGASAGRSSTSRLTTRPGSCMRRSCPREGPHDGPLPRPGAALVSLPGHPGPPAADRQRQPVRVPGLPPGGTPARAEALSDPAVPATDERLVRALDPDGPRRVPLSRGVRGLRSTPLRAGPLRHVVQRGAPSPGHRRSDASAAAQREARRLTV
jgi:hypothetical protein